MDSFELCCSIEWVIDRFIILSYGTSDHWGYQLFIFYSQLIYNYFGWEVNISPVSD